ncbi:MAG: hypothetical protein JWN40_1665 [Phycisphaerales bacterium]|nr:hypothetical protein [Phycisphaerales bacterium]
MGIKVRDNSISRKVLKGADLDLLRTRNGPRKDPKWTRFGTSFGPAPDPQRTVNKNRPSSTTVI